MRLEFELRNLPLHRLMEYLVQAGGTATGERAVTGEKWRAELIVMEPALVKPSTWIRRDLLVIEGEDAETQRVGDFMRSKTMRGGG